MGAGGPACRAEDWPRWRGPGGNAVSADAPLPWDWNTHRNVRWKVEIDGEGCSSPVVHGQSVFLTSAFESGTRRAVHCLDRASGTTRWRRTVEDDDPEVTSSLAGHAAATPATDGQRVVAFFGRAGLVSYDMDGKLLWRLGLGRLESELGLASSPILDDRRILVLCDHDGDRFHSFDSCLLAVDLDTGRVSWKTARPGQYRSWSTPIVVPAAGGRSELVVNAQDQLRAYDPRTGKPLWQVTGMTGWVAPSPVFGHGLIFATSGRNGPVMAVRPGGAGDATATHVVWSDPAAGPYVCSPVLYGDYLYVHNELGVLTCYHAATGRIEYRQRLAGKFYASSVAGDGKVYLASDEGTTYVVEAGPTFELLAANRLEEYSLASPAIAGHELFLRTQNRLYCVGLDAGR